MIGPWERGSSRAPPACPLHQAFTTWMGRIAAPLGAHRRAAAPLLAPGQARRRRSWLRRAPERARKDPVRLRAERARAPAGQQRFPTGPTRPEPQMRPRVLRRVCGDPCVGGGLLGPGLAGSESGLGIKGAGAARRRMSVKRRAKGAGGGLGALPTLTRARPRPRRRARLTLGEAGRPHAWLANHACGISRLDCLGAVPRGTGLACLAGLEPAMCVRSLTTHRRRRPKGRNRRGGLSFVSALESKTCVVGWPGASHVRAVSPAPAPARRRHVETRLRQDVETRSHEPDVHGCVKVLYRCCIVARAPLQLAGRLSRGARARARAAAGSIFRARRGPGNLPALRPG